MTRNREPGLPRHMLEKYKAIVLATQGRGLTDGEADLEAMNMLEGMSFVVDLQVNEIRRMKLHRILTNWQPKVELKLVDERFFGDLV